MAQAFANEKMFTCIHKHYSVEVIKYIYQILILGIFNFFFYNDVKEWKDFSAANSQILEYMAVSSGTSDADFTKCNQIIDETKVPFICLDVANGYSEHFIDHVRRVREVNPATTIIAGNVVTGEIAEELLLTGADIIKIGIGPGSVCTTRKQTG
jgi:GMP reductase